MYNFSGFVVKDVLDLKVSQALCASLAEDFGNNHDVQSCGAIW